MTVYCIDTSALIAAWQERYPPENFPPFWRLMGSLIDDGRLVAPMEVLLETQKRSDELHKWLAERKHMFRELEDEIQIAAASSFSAQVWLYPAWRRRLAHSCGVKQSRSSPIRFQRASMVRSAALRSKFLSFENISSIGFKSGL